MSYTKAIEKNLNKIIAINAGRNQFKEHSLFDLRTIKPNHTDNTKYVNLGPLLGKKYYRQFIDACKNNSIKIDRVVYSRVCVEVSQIDGVPYIEISLDKRCYLPIAGKQYPVLEDDAMKNSMSLIGFADSLNFILNDSRNFN